MKIGHKTSVFVADMFIFARTNYDTMVENDSRMKICNNCTKKKLNLQRGLLCSLTDEKPAFEGECENYEEVPFPEVSEEDGSLLIEEEAENEIGGWLSVFLWVGLGGGALMSLFNIFSQLSLLRPLYSFILLATGACLVCIAVAAIVAFFKRKPNAVALAKTYIAMIAIDAAVSFVSIFVFDDQTAWKPALRSVVWSCVWFTYLCCSTRVEAVIPKSTRVWNGFEKLVLCIYIAANVIFVGSISAVVSGSLPVDTVYDNNSFIESAIEESQVDLPQYMGDGMYLQDMKKEGNDVIWVYKLSTVYKSSYSSYDIYMLGVEIKSSLMEDLQGWESDPFLKAVFDGGYTLVVRYIDATDAVLHESRLDKSDFE